MSIAVKMNDPSTTGVNAATGNSSLTGSNAADLQSSFLTLLVAQLKNQDPTNPLQNNELTTQLAQISTVSGIEKLNTTLGSISGQIDNSQSLQASTLIGHGVMIPGTTILTGKGAEEGAKTTTTPFGVELQQPADKVTATITDKDGKVVRTIDIGGLKAGVHTFTGRHHDRWHGCTKRFLQRVNCCQQWRNATGGTAASVCAGAGRYSQ